MAPVSSWLVRPSSSCWVSAPGLVAYYNGGLPLGLGGRRRTSNLAYLPADAAAVGYADVRAIMDSEFRQKLRQALPTGEELGKFKEELGVDIEHDIDTVTAAYMGGALASHQRRGGRPRPVQRRADRNAGHPARHGRRRLQGQAHADDDPQGRRRRRGHRGPASGRDVAFLEPGVLAFGDAAAVQRAIDAGATRATRCARTPN